MKVGKVSKGTSRYAIKDGGDGVIYVLSTTVIQGIVPNEELAKSTGPFGLAYSHMFTPFIGSVIKAWANALSSQFPR